MMIIFILPAAFVLVAVYLSMMAEVHLNPFRAPAAPTRATGKIYRFQSFQSPVGFGTTALPHR